MRGENEKTSAEPNKKAKFIITRSRGPDVHRELLDNYLFYFIHVITILGMSARPLNYYIYKSCRTLAAQRCQATINGDVHA